ncbi:MAG: DNA gyrase inhibitor YacG [Janthinobacterium lividum]
MSGKCPICGRRTELRFRPFCSVRCADADLGRWFSGHYRVPGPPLDDDDAAPSECGALRRVDPDDGLG